MKIDTLVLGAYQTNCYVLRENSETSDCLVIDTGLETRQPAGFCQSHKLRPTAVILTHGHADHILGLQAMRKAFDEMKVYIHRLDSPLLTDPGSNLSILTGAAFSETEAADILVEEGTVIEEAGIKLQVIHTPGHTRGGICLYSGDEGILFSGDTLFAQSVGRTDFPGGDMELLIGSIREKLLTLPDETRVYPGHGPATTIAREKTSNPFL